MPLFKVGRAGFWDGASLHQPGTVLKIEPSEYPRLLKVDMEGMDADANKALAEARKTVGYVAVPVAKAGDLNPNNRDDLRVLAGKGATVVSTP
jgi:hypothetical protein